MARTAHQVAGHAHPFGKAAFLVETVTDHQRLGIGAQRVDIEQPVHGIEPGPQFPRPAQLLTVFLAVETLLQPDPVEVLVDEAGGAGIGGIEGEKGLVVDEGEGQPAGTWPDAFAQQPVHGDGAADLVAVGHRVQHHVRPGPSAVEAGDEGNAGIARAMVLDVRGHQFDRIVLHGGRRVSHGRALPPGRAAPPAVPPPGCDAPAPAAALPDRCRPPPASGPA